MFQPPEFCDRLAVVLRFSRNLKKVVFRGRSPAAVSKTETPNHRVQWLEVQPKNLRS